MQKVSPPSGLLCSYNRGSGPSSEPLTWSWNQGILCSPRPWQWSRGNMDLNKVVLVQNENSR